MNVNITQSRMILYSDLTIEGKCLVDGIAIQLEDEITKRNKKAHIGPGGARELALALLQYFWSGCMPENYGRSTN